jgi:ribosomal protein L1
LHLRLGVNVRHAEEQLRGTLALPHGLGKDVTIAVFAQGQQARDAEAAGADFVGGQELVEKVQEGWTDFDVAISTPDMMKTVGQLGRVLGPQGKMPNPKVGTVTDDIEKAVTESKSGKIEYRTDRQAIIHLAIGKASFDEQKLLDNCLAVIDEVVRAKTVLLEGQVHPLGDADDDDGSRHPRGRRQDRRPRGRGGSGRIPRARTGARNRLDSPAALPKTTGKAKPRSPVQVNHESRRKGTGHRGDRRPDRGRRSDLRG